MRRVIRRPSDTSRRTSTPSTESFLPKTGLDRRASLPYPLTPTRSPILKRSAGDPFRGPPHHGSRMSSTSSKILEDNEYIAGGIDKRTVVKLFLFMGLTCVAIVLYSLYRLLT
ncbi:hypothetical protein ACF0H5_002460 [Mactra antiquata]